jgi:hypothetical protein
LDIIRDFLTSTSSKLVDCLFTSEQLLDLLKFVLTSTAFRFKGSFYKQLNGTPMGSPISCVVAELAMERIESVALRSLIVQPALYRRFVDDSFFLISDDTVDTLFSTFNAVHPKFQFTIEKETDSKLPFLDVLVCHGPTGIYTTVYRKPTHTDRYLQFDSCHPIQHKAAVVDTLVHRALTIPSSDLLRDCELSHVRRSLVSNGYPARFVSSRVTIVKNRISKSQFSDVRDAVGKVFLPYLPGISEGLSRLLRSAGLMSISIPCNRVSSLLPNVKDRILPVDTPSVVYCVGCTVCSVEYIGETKRKLGTRLKEHASDIKHSRFSTALSEHFRDTGHTFDFGNAKILHRSARYHDRTFLEAWEIQCRSISKKSCCNSSSGKTTVPATYLALHSACRP